MKRISATEASRSFSDVLNRARYEGESFLVERNGEPVAEIRPARRPSTVADFARLMRASERLDPDFVEDMKEIVAARKRMLPRDPWVE